MPPSILGVGVDVVKTSRLRRTYDRFGARFLRRAFADSEIQEFLSRGSGDGGVHADIHNVLSVGKADEIHTSVTSRQIEFLASRWAVKEACHKALKNWRLPFTEIVLRSSGKSLVAGGESDVCTSILESKLEQSIEHNLYRKNSSSPYISFEGSAAQVAETLGISKTHASISHDGAYALAVVILESDRNILNGVS